MLFSTFAAFFFFLKETAKIFGISRLKVQPVNVIMISTLLKKWHWLQFSKSNRWQVVKAKITTLLSTATYSVYQHLNQKLLIERTYAYKKLIQQLHIKFRTEVWCQMDEKVDISYGTCLWFLFQISKLYAGKKRKYSNETHTHEWCHWNRPVTVLGK